MCEMFNLEIKKIYEKPISKDKEFYDLVIVYKVPYYN